MTRSAVTSSPWQKAVKAGRLLVQHGPAGLLRKLREHFAYHLDSKWHFVYLHFELDKEFSRIPESSALAVRVAEAADCARIEAELYPEMRGEQAEETKYFGLVGDPGVRCFIGDRDGRLVHYSWVFLDAGASPIVDTPFNRQHLQPGDVYIGPIFTVPGARGFIYPQVLATIVRYLKSQPGARRIVVLVQGKNPAAVSFYKRLGFIEIVDAQRRPWWARAGGRLYRND